MSTPTQEMGRLTQFTGAYASTTMDKATEVQQPMKEKQDKIVHLEQSFEIEKQKIVNQWQGKFTKLQKSFSALKVQYDTDLQTRDTQIHEL